jgi:uncharacterized surface protein with fasciclin (FAS1) repeats
MSELRACATSVLRASTRFRERDTRRDADSSSLSPCGRGKKPRNAAHLASRSRKRVDARKTEVAHARNSLIDGSRGAHSRARHTARAGSISAAPERRRRIIKHMGDSSMSKQSYRVAAAALVVATAAFAAPAFAEPMVGGAPMYATKNIIQNAVNSKDHTTLVAAVKAAGLVDTLEGKGPFTVFAPTNKAFDKLPKGTVDTLLKPENKAQLTKILTCHVVAANAMSSAINKMIKDDKGSHPVKTVGGCTLTAKKMGDKITLTDEKGDVATVTIADVKQSNGVIHVIDTVLLPAS